MKRKISLLAMSLILAASLCHPCAAQPFFGEGLNLTDEQKQELQRIRVDAKDQIIPLGEQLSELREQMEEIILADETIDTEAASALHEKIIEKRSEIMAIEYNAKLQSAQVLTLDQRKVMIESKKARRSRRGERREGRMPRFDGIKDW